MPPTPVAISRPGRPVGMTSTSAHRRWPTTKAMPGPKVFSSLRTARTRSGSGPEFADPLVIGLAVALAADGDDLSVVAESAAESAAGDVVELEGSRSSAEGAAEPLPGDDGTRVAG